MFAGLLCVDGARAPADLVRTDVLLAALTPFHPPDAAGAWQDGPFLLVQAIQGEQADPANSGIAVPGHCAGSGRVVAFWGRLDDRDDLSRALGRSLSDETDPTLVLAAYDRWGASCPERLMGDFAVAIYDPSERRLLLFRDRLGVKPLYYLAGEGFVFFATTATAFAHLGRRAPAPDLDWAARVLAGVSDSSTATGLAGVRKLAPGHAMEVHPGASRLTRYHAWRDDPPWTLRRNPDRVEEYRSVLEESIRCRMRGAERMGSESSGGLDSSTVTAYLARFLGDPGDRLCAFGWAVFELEPEYIIEVSRQAGISHNYLLTSFGQLTDDDIGRGLAAVGYPEPAASAIANIPFYAECRRRGIGTLFSGFGGDEGVTNSGSLLGRELLDHHAYLELRRLLPGGQLTRTLRVVRARAKSPGWGGGHPRLAAALKARWPYQVVRTEVADRLGLHDAYSRLAEFDGPYRRINDSVLHHRLGPWVPTRLETCTLVAATFGVEYRWPLLDARLIQQYLSTPSIEKADRAASRYLHRRAVAGVVAAKVTWKRDKYMGESRSSGGLTEADSDASVVNEARRQEAHLHAALAEIIDVEAFHAQIESAVSGQLEGDARLQFGWNVDNVRWLNQWLSGGPPPS
jgi:asparagine synthase (glutamine-hydrolysing)